MKQSQAEPTRVQALIIAALATLVTLLILALIGLRSPEVFRVVGG